MFLYGKGFAPEYQCFIWKTSNPNLLLHTTYIHGSIDPPILSNSMHSSMAVLGVLEKVLDVLIELLSGWTKLGDAEVFYVFICVYLSINLYLFF